MNDAAKEFNEWRVAKLEGMLQVLKTQRVLTKDAYDCMYDLLHGIANYTTMLERTIDRLSKSTEPVVTPV